MQGSLCEALRCETLERPQTSPKAYATSDRDISESTDSSMNIQIVMVIVKYLLCWLIPN